MVEERSDREGSIAEIFYRVGALLTEAQILKTIPPDTPVVDAIDIMRETGYSQLPVVVGDEVLGVFSFRSLAFEMRDIPEPVRVSEMKVEDCIESPEFARLTDEVARILPPLNLDNAVLVGDPNHLQGIVTPIDVAIFVERIARAFVLLQEIELALRALIERSAESPQISKCAEASLKQAYEGQEDRIPTRLPDMTFSEYVQIVSYGDCWPLFEPTFGGSRQRVRARLQSANDLRNDVFHFKRDLAPEDLSILTDVRDWLLMRARVADARQAEGREE